MLTSYVEITFSTMIQTALWELNEERGSSEEAISNYIQKEYHELPWAHATILKHNLSDLCVKRKIIMTHDKCYKRCSLITKSTPSLSLCHRLSPCSSPIPSHNSSSSDSLFSSPSSSSSSFWSRPCRRRNRPLKRKRKRKRSRKMRGVEIQVRRRGRPRKGEIRPPKMVKARRRGRPSKRDTIGETSQVVNDVIARIGQQEQSQQEQQKNIAIVEKRVPLEDQIEVTVGEKGDFEEVNEQHVKEKGTVKLRRRGRKQNDTVEEENQSCEQHKKAKEQHCLRKQYKFTWIGRGDHIKGKGEHVNQRRSRSQQHSVNKEQNQPCEQHEEGIKGQNSQPKWYNVVWIGRRVRKSKVIEIQDDVEDEDVAMISSDVEEDEQVEGLKWEEEQGSSVAHNQSLNQQDDIAKEKIFWQELNGLEDRVIEEKDQLQEHCINQEMIEKDVEMTGGPNEIDPKRRLQMEEENEEQGAVKIQIEAQVRHASSEQNESEQIQPQKQAMEGTKEKFQPYGKQQPGEIVNITLGKQIEMAGESHQHEEQQSEMIQKERLLIEENTEEQQDVIKKEAQLTGKNLELNELKEQHDDVTEELVQPQEKFQSCAKDCEENGEVESAEERPQQEEQQPEVNHKEIELVIELTKVQQDLLVHQSEAQTKEASFEQHESEKQECVSEKHISPQDHCIEDSEEIHDSMIIRREPQVEGHKESEEQQNVEQVQPQELSMEDTNEESQAIDESSGYRHEKKEAPLDNNQSEECDNGVTVERHESQEHVEVIKEKKQQDIRPSRQGLRSMSKKEEEARNAEVTPVRRSLRHKTNSEAAVVTEHAGQVRTSKRKPSNVEAKQASKTRKTARN